MTTSPNHSSTSRPRTLVSISRPSINGYARLRLTLGPALWRAIGCPTHIHLQRLDDQLLIAETHPHNGYQVVAEHGGLCVWCDPARNVLGGLPDGDYQVAVHSSMLVISIPQYHTP